jgi:hypothetical protein
MLRRCGTFYQLFLTPFWSGTYALTSQNLKAPVIGMDYARILEDVGFNATHTRNQYCIFICKIELHELYMFSYNGSS